MKKLSAISLVKTKPATAIRMAALYSGDSDMNDPRKGSDAEPTTHFGYKNVPESQKAEKVAEVFHSVAAKYDLMNDLLSGGMHRLWKRFAIELSGVRTGNRVLDIAGGTGDLTKKFSHLVGPTGQVVLADINESMLKVGRDRLLDLGVAGNVEFVQADAEKLPFPDNHFDCVTIAFGLRNVTHKEDALRSMLRVLKPGGRPLSGSGDSGNRRPSCRIPDSAIRRRRQVVRAGCQPAPDRPIHRQRRCAGPVAPPRLRDLAEGQAQSCRTGA